MAMLLLHTSALFFPTTTATLSYHKASIARTQKSFSIACSFRQEYIPNHIQDPNYVRVFDTTLREGKHDLGTDMAPKQKLGIAHQIAKLGIDIIEVGYFNSNKDDDLESFKLIAHEVGNNLTNEDDGRVPVICALASCTKEDIGKAWECLKYAKFPRIHLSLSTREIDTKYNLRRSSQEEVIGKAKSMVAYARSLGFCDIEFTPVDDGRSEREFLYEFLDELIKAGATTLNIPEIAGYLPHEYRQLIIDIRANTPGIESVILSTHCQNDLGLATANTLEGAYSGARQVEVTINGIGEDGGHASLKEVVTAMRGKTKLLGGLHNGVKTSQILMASNMVEEHISRAARQTN